MALRCGLRRNADIAELLPLCIASCSSFLTLYSTNLPKRLWCIAELANRALICAPETHVPSLIYDLDESFPAANEDVQVFDALLAHCEVEADEETLRRAIRATPGAHEAPFAFFGEQARGELSSLAACVIRNF